MTGVGPRSGNKVSHANNRTKTRNIPNLQKKRFFVKSKKVWRCLKLSTRAIRTIDKFGGDVEAAAREYKELKKWI